MGQREKIAGALVLALSMTVVAAGCGGSSGTTSAGTTEKSKTTKAEAAKPFPSVSKSKIPTFGEAADSREREAASRLLARNLKAREAADFATQCATLSPSAVKRVAEFAKIQGVGGGGCTKELKGRAEPLRETTSLREDTLTGQIESLRVKEIYGYAIWSARGAEFAMPMERSNGEWKVAEVLEETLGVEG